MTLEEFIAETGARALILPSPDLPIPAEYPKRWGFKAYKVTMRRDDYPAGWSFPFFSTEQPYTASILRSFATDARWYEEGPEQGDDPTDEFEAALAGARQIADALRSFFGEDAYETLMTDVDL